MSKSVNIISFDVPFPANYGGVIDVFYKLKCLHEQGVKIILHCFEYGRGKQPELEKYCEQVFYYKRNTNFAQQLSAMPYIVISRTNNDLLRNLLKNNYPILFEGLHTCFLMNHPKLKSRLKIYRESNIEHEYYRALAKAEKKLIKRIYFNIEAKRLEWFEHILNFADIILPVSLKDEEYLKNKYTKAKTFYIPSFHANNEFHCKTGKGDYILYHGNLMVAENILAAEYLIENIFSKLEIPCKIAGLKPSNLLKQKIASHKNIELIANPSNQELSSLIQNAHINILYTDQATGLKLKLLNVLYEGRFCICNDKMLAGTSIDELCVISNNSNESINHINELMKLEFTSNEIERRKLVLENNFSNQQKTAKLIELL